MEIQGVRFRVSGGFAGLVRGCEVGSDALTAADRRSIEQAVTRTSGAGGGTARAPGARDARQFDLSVDTDDGVRELSFDEMSVPPSLDGLVGRLEQQSRPMPL